MDVEHINLTAIFAKATTTVDGGWRISFDIDESQSNEIAKLSQFRDLSLQLVIVPIKPN